MGPYHNTSRIMQVRRYSDSRKPPSKTARSLPGSAGLEPLSMRVYISTPLHIPSHTQSVRILGCLFGQLQPGTPANHAHDTSYSKGYNYNLNTVHDHPPQQLQHKCRFNVQPTVPTAEAVPKGSLHGRGRLNLLQ